MNYEKLNALIIKKFGSLENFSKAIGWSMKKLNSRMSGEKEFVQWELCKIRDLLQMTDNQVNDIFFPDVETAPDPEPATVPTNRQEYHPRYPMMAIRRSLNMTRKEAAAAIGIQPDTLAKWEHGLTVPNIRYASAIRRTFGVDLNEINFSYDPALMTVGKSVITTDEVLAMMRILGDLPRRDRDLLLDELKAPDLYRQDKSTATA